MSVRLSSSVINCTSC